MITRIIIVADTNDGDYVTSINDITKEQIELIKPIIEKVKNFKPYQTEKKTRWVHSHNYPWGEYSRQDLGEKTPEELYYTDDVTEEQWELWENLLPYGEDGIHTIVSIKTNEIFKEEKLL